MILSYLIMLQPRRQSFHQNSFNMARMNLWTSESNAFSMSTETKGPPILLQLHISTMSDINLPPSLMNLYLIYAVCCVETKLDRTIFSLSERVFEIILVSTFGATLVSNGSPIFFFC